VPPAMAEVTKPGPDGDGPAGVSKGQELDSRGFPPLRTICFQCLRGRNVGVPQARVLRVDVTRDTDGSIGIGLDGDDRILEITNPHQHNLKVGDQIRAVNGVHLGPDNIIAALKHVPRNLETFPVEILRWPQQPPVDPAELYAECEVWTYDGDPSRPVRRIAFKESRFVPRGHPAFNVSLVATLRSAESHVAVVRVLRDGVFGVVPVGEVRLPLEDLGPCEAPACMWTLLAEPHSRFVHGEVLCRVTRCDWASRLGTSPHVGRVRKQGNGLRALLAEATSAVAEVFPLHKAVPLDRIQDIALPPELSHDRITGAGNARHPGGGGMGASREGR